MITFARALVGRYIYENVGIEISGGYITGIRVGLEDYDVSSLLIPGFVDVHSHLTSYALSLTRPRLDGIESLEEALRFIARKVEEVEAEVIVMEGYDDTLWPRAFTKDDLDRITDRPLIVRRVCGHKAVLNSAAIRWLKERYGEIEGLNEESGLAVEHLPLNLSRYVRPSEAEIEEAIRKAEEIARRLGIVAVGENTKAFYVRKLIEMDRRGELTLRWRVAVYYDDLKTLGDLIGYRSDHLRIVGVKEFLDGSVGARTAAFSFPYADTGRKGNLLHSDDYLLKVLREAERLGLGVWFHAIGDEAIDQALRVIGHSSHPERHRIEHFLFPRMEHYRTAAALGVGIAVQPNFTRRWGKAGGLYQRVIGDAVYWHNRYRTMENLGVRYAFSSDTMPPGPIYGLSGAVYHPLKDERLTLREALYRYTTAGAELLGDKDYGEIEVGKLALLSTVCTECLARVQT